MIDFSAPADGPELLMHQLPASPWWNLLPVAEHLIALLQPTCVQLEAPSGALPEDYLRFRIGLLSPNTSLLVTPGCSKLVMGGTQLLLLDDLPPLDGFDLAGWLLTSPNDRWVLLRQSSALASFQQQFPGWEARWCSLPHLLVPVAVPNPAWSLQLEQQAAALLDLGQRLDLFTQLVDRKPNPPWQALEAYKQELLEKALAKLEAIESSTIWRATALMRASLDHLARLRARRVREPKNGVEAQSFPWPSPLSGGGDAIATASETNLQETSLIGGTFEDLSTAVLGNSSLPIRYSPEVDQVRFALTIHWSPDSLGVAVDQIVAGSAISLTSYFFWPFEDAWESLNSELRCIDWIADGDRAELLNKAAEVINYWQEKGKRKSVDEARLKFPDIHFLSDTPRHRQLGLLGYVSGNQPIDCSKPSVLVISHESSFTGAAILAWSLCHGFKDQANLIVLTPQPDVLGQSLLDDCCLLLRPARPGPAITPHGLLQGELSHLKETLGIKLALVNTIRCWEWPRCLHSHGIPSLLLIHKYAADLQPSYAFQEACTWANAVVLSSPLTWRAITRRHPLLVNVPVKFLPQGRWALPGKPSTAVQNFHLSDLPELRRRHSRAWLERCHLVLGAGELQPSDGIDLFVQTANSLHSKHPQEPWLFLWLGSPDNSEGNFESSLWIEDQIERSGLAQYLQILRPSRELLAALFGRAQLFLFPCRLDPFPNLAIDAMHEGVPVLCFAGASGIAEWMTTLPELAEPCLAHYLDTSHLAERAEELLLDDERRHLLGALSKQLARHSFTEDGYLASLKEIGRQCQQSQLQLQLDRELLELTGCLDQAVCLPFEAAGVADPVMPYLLSWSRHILPRKPFAGFHPGVYAELQPSGGQDPLADWLRAGQPPGPWQRSVIQSNPTAAPPRLSVALHLHVHYVELLQELLERLQGNKLRPQLFVSLSIPAEEAPVRGLLQRWGHESAELVLTPNRGRDIGPLLVEFGRRMDRDFEFHGHLHTKKSELIGQKEAGRWRHFLLEHMLGTATHPMLDAVATAMAEAPSLGLAFPDDPHALSLGANREPATALAKQLGLPLPLTEAEDFPVGSMFWARRGSLRSLYELPWRYEDFPEEPLCYDGTLLHAIERLLPVINEAAGFQAFGIHRPGVRR